MTVEASAETQTPPDIQEFQATAHQLMGEINYDLDAGPRGLPSGDGIITQQSLRSSLRRVSEAAQTDPSVMALVAAVNQANRAAVNEDGQRPSVNVSDRPEMALLKIFGAVEPLKKAETVDSADPATGETTDQISGQQILADGRMVLGLVVPGRNEIRTPNGIVRTRGTPRTSL